ncbi:MAG TPA: hypothetical protein VF986_03225 [Actinomycetota bacterium]
MRSRAFVVFWGATAASVFLLGSLWATVSRIRSSPGGPSDWIVALIAGSALAASLFVAGRVVFVLGRVKKRARQAARKRATHLRRGARS